MPPKAKIPAPIDRPLSRSYLREFRGWSTAYPPGLSEPSSLRIMENIGIGRDGSAQVRPGLRYLSYAQPPLPAVGEAPPLEGLQLRGAVAYNDAADAALPAGTQVGDLVVVSAGGGNWSGGKQKPYNLVGHGANVDPRLTGYILHHGGEQWWGTVTDLSPLPIPSFDLGTPGVPTWSREGGVHNGSAWTVVATFYDASGYPLTASLHLHEARSEPTEPLTEIVTTPVDGPVISLLMQAEGWSTSQYNPPGMTQAIEAYVHGIHYTSAVAQLPAFTWGPWGSYQIYERILTQLRVSNAGTPGSVDIPGLAFDLPFVGTHEPFYLNDGTKAYLLAVREADESVGFRVLSLLGTESAMMTLAEAGFEVAQGEAILNFSSETTYVKYLQIDNKIFALSNAGESMRIFKVGEEKSARKLYAIERPDWTVDDKLTIVHPDAAWINNAPTTVRKNLIRNPSFENGVKYWEPVGNTQLARDANGADPALAGGYRLKMSSTQTKTNFCVSPAHDAATYGTDGWFAGFNSSGVDVSPSNFVRFNGAAGAAGRTIRGHSRWFTIAPEASYRVGLNFEAHTNADEHGILVRFYDTGANQVGGDYTKQWTAAVARRATTDIKAPKGAAYAQILPFIITGGAASAPSFSISNVCMRANTTDTAALDGDDGVNYYWEGVANQSRSLYHPPVMISAESEFISVTVAEHVASAYRMADTTVRDTRVLLAYYNSEGTWLGSNVAAATPNSAAWTRQSVNSIAPAGAVKAKVSLQVLDVPRGENHYFDGAMLEKTTTLGTYFDGDTVDTATEKYSWRGVAHESRSRQGTYTATPAIPAAETPTVSTLVSSDAAANDFSVGMFYTFSNEVGESWASQVSVIRVQRPWQGWLWETPDGAGAPSGTRTSDAELAADQLVAILPEDAFNQALLEGATEWSLYVLTWSDQSAVPETGLKVARRTLKADSVYGTNGWLQMTAQTSGLNGDTMPLPAETNRHNYSDPSRGGQGIVAADRLVMVYDPVAPASIKWSSNQQGRYTDFTAAHGGGYKTLTSGNMFIPAAVKLWQNPQSVDTLTVLCLGVDGQSTGYYMAPAEVTSNSGTVSIMAFEETTATPGTTSPYGCEVLNNALFHPLEDQLMKSTAQNYNINHKSVSELIRPDWGRLLHKEWIVSSQHDMRLYYLVHNPDGATLEEGCRGNEIWVYDAGTGAEGTWARWLIQGEALRKIERGGSIYMSVIRPDGVFYLDPNYAFDDSVDPATLLVTQTNIPWRLETNTQGANRAHDAWARIQHLSVNVGNFLGKMRYGIRSWDINGKRVDISKILQDPNPASTDHLPFDLEDYLMIRADLKEWHFYAESVSEADVVQPSSGQINLVQYRYTPSSVNTGYELGSIETFEYGRAAANGGGELTFNGIPNPLIDQARP